MLDVIHQGNPDQMNFTIASAIILLVATFVLTILPAKNPEWDDAEERV